MGNVRSLAKRRVNHLWLPIIQLPESSKPQSSALSGSPFVSQAAGACFELYSGWVSAAFR
jgi:hypothetical protein